MAHLRAVPDPDDRPDDEQDVHEQDVAELVDPAAAVTHEPDEPKHVDEPVPDPDPEPDPAEEPRRYPSTIGGAFYICILIAAGVALVIGTQDDWRLGIQILGGSLLVAALLRLILASRDAGMLAVRHRVLDVCLLSGAGIALIALATSIPNQPV